MRDEGGYRAGEGYRSGYVDYDKREFGRRPRDDDFGADLRDRDWGSESLDQVNLDFYQPSATVQSRSQEEVEAYYEEKNITLVQGNNVPKPILSFDEASFPEEVSGVIGRKDFQSPMPVQSVGWPIVLSGRDLVAIGQTGSGKTLGFLLPAIMHVQQQAPLHPGGNGPIVLVMAPTRELVQQTHAVLAEFLRPLRLRAACVFGGAPRGRQIREIEGGVHFIIATPGRLIDYLQCGVASLNRCSYVVMDEADRMLDMGFEPQIRKILQQVRPDRQMLMWSATWPRSVQVLANDFFSKEDYVHFNIGSTNLSANHDIKQIVDVVQQHRKVDRLLDVSKLTSVFPKLFSIYCII